MIALLDGPDADWPDRGYNRDRTPPKPVPPTLTELLTDESGTLVLAYGKHIVAGHLILRKDVVSPQSIVVFIALGEGVWDGVDAFYYAGALLSASNYHFHPGMTSTGTNDPVQGVDSFHSGGLTYSRTAYIAVNVPSEFFTNFEPSKFKGIYRTSRVPDYDHVGNRVDSGSYSANPARCAAHAVIDRAGFPASRIDWPSWVAFRDFCIQTITWDKDGDGVAETTIPRFECHLAFQGDVSLATALDMICGTAGVVWQDDGNRIVFKLPTDENITHDFNESNIIENSVNSYAKYLKERPNRLQCTFRDVQTQYLSEVKEEARPREPLLDVIGVSDPGTIQFGNMNVSQAQRLLERVMRAESDNPTFVELTGMSDSMHVLPGDYVSVTHTALGWRFVRCIVVEATYESAEKSVDEVNFLLQRIDAPLYYDSDHRPVQAQMTP